MNVVEIRIGHGRAADRRLTGLIDAIYRAEHFAAIRSLSVHILAVLGAFLWVGLNFPGTLPGTLLRIADGLFAVIVILAIFASVREQHWQNLQHRAITKSP
jgi:hypothetical protein